MDVYQAGVENQSLLYAYIAREALGLPGGREAVREAVRVYGNERGARMAQRALQDGLPLNAENFLLYGEWFHPESQMVLEGCEPEVHLQNRSCPWFEAWKAEGMLAQGRHYCEVVDAALADGFSPGMVMETVAYQSDPNSDTCDFIFRGQSMDTQAQERLTRNKQLLAMDAKKDWNFHTYHLLASFRRTLGEILGVHVEAGITKRALESYEARFGRDALEHLQQLRAPSYLQTEDYAGTRGLEI